MAELIELGLVVDDELVYRRSLPLATRELLLQRSSLGALAGVVGASSMVVEQLFSREALVRLVRLGGPERALDRAASGPLTLTRRPRDLRSRRSPGP